MLGIRNRTVGPFDVEAGHSVGKGDYQNIITIFIIS